MIPKDTSLRFFPVPCCNGILNTLCQSKRNVRLQLDYITFSLLMSRNIWDLLGLSEPRKTSFILHMWPKTVTH